MLQKYNICNYNPTTHFKNLAMRKNIIIIATMLLFCIGNAYSQSKDDEKNEFKIRITTEDEKAL